MASDVVVSGTPLGFSMWCPHCFNWTYWKGRDPGEYAVNDDEWASIVASLRATPESFRHGKLLTCSHHPNAGCPVSFQAFICDNPTTAHRRRLEVPSWIPARAFRLRDVNHKGHLRYSVVLFSAHPVPRNRHIVLEKLLDPALLGRAVLGMSQEIDAPVSIFTPTFLDPEKAGNEVWLPLEAYDHERRLVPGRFNAFCEICREAFLAPIVDACVEKHVSAMRCPAKCGVIQNEQHLCIERPAPCELAPPLWSQCAYFTHLRSAECQCYRSDLALIVDMQKSWARGALDERKCVPRKCWAGLHERALPIIIHEHFAGVAMTGQFLLRGDSASIDLDRLLCENPLLRPHRHRLRRVLALVSGSAEPRNGTEHYTLRFVVDAERLSQIERRFMANVGRIQDAANFRYRHDRARAEAAFREELLGRVSLVGTQRTERQTLLLHLLERMRDFWAFRNVYWFTWNANHCRFALTARTTNQGSATYMNVAICDLPLDLSSLNCHAWLYRRAAATSGATAQGEPVHRTNTWLDTLQQAYEKAGNGNVPELSTEADTSHFFVPVKSGQALHVLVFAERDAAKVSPLRPADRGTVSHICQHVLADTCDGVVRAYLALDNLDLLQWQQKQLTLGAVGSTLVHDLRHALVLARDDADELRREAKSQNVSWAEDYLLRLQDSIRANLRMLDDVSRFRKSKAAVLRSIQLHDFLDECLADARLPHKGISPDLRVDPTEQALLDPLLVRVGLDNILTNIKQQSQHVTKVVVTASTFSAGGVRIRVQDNGRGFPPDVLSEFDALYHGGVLTAPAETLGLGLVIAKSVMDIHGGQLRIGNDADHGGWVEMLFLGGGSKAEERGAR